MSTTYKLISGSMLAMAAVCQAEECTCASARPRGGWCDACKVGYLAGIKIPSYALFEAIDAHGHDVKPDRIQCASCQWAMATDGYCERSRMGFVNKQAYLSRLTYELARGKPTSVDQLTCAACRAHAGRYGWCEACERGMIGNVAIRDRQDFAKTTVEFRRLLQAIRKLADCETCAVALFTGGTCMKCGISYTIGSEQRTSKETPHTNKKKQRKP